MRHKSENCSKILQQYSFNILFGKFVHIFGKLVHIFGELVHIFGKLVHIFAWKLVSRTSKQVSRKLGPLWQPGVYNDTNIWTPIVWHILGAYFFANMEGGGGPNYFHSLPIEVQSIHAQQRQDWMRASKMLGTIALRLEATHAKGLPFVAKRLLPRACPSFPWFFLNFLG